VDIASGVPRYLAARRKRRKRENIAIMGKRADLVNSRRRGAACANFVRAARAAWYACGEESGDSPIYGGGIFSAMIEHEAALRLIAFGAVLAAVALWESRAPRRARAFARRVRWPNNLGVVALNTLVVRAIFPVTAVAFALEGERRGWGLLNNLHLSAALKIVAAVTLLDFAIYLQHVMFHAAPAFWRIHRMHHADLDFDVTTGVRFHPAEIVLSMAYKLGVIAALGASAASVFVFEALLNATSMFNHANLRLPARADSILRIFMVTPDMHRVHHSIAIDETNSNFGFNLPWWDWMLGTYKAQPAAGHERMTIGIEQFREAGELRLDRMLTQPLRGSTGGYAITRGDGE